MVPEQSVVSQFTGSGDAATGYPVGFCFASADDIEAWVKDADGQCVKLEPMTGFEVIGDAKAAEVFTAEPVPATSTLVVTLSPECAQSVDLKKGATLSPEAIETALDKMVLALQSLKACSVSVHPCYKLDGLPAGSTLTIDEDGYLVPSSTDKPVVVAPAGSVTLEQVKGCIDQQLGILLNCLTTTE